MISSYPSCTRLPRWRRPKRWWQQTTNTCTGQSPSNWLITLWQAATCNLETCWVPEPSVALKSTNSAVCWNWTGEEETTLLSQTDKQGNSLLMETPLTFKAGLRVTARWSASEIVRELSCQYSLKLTIVDADRYWSTLSFLYWIQMSFRLSLSSMTDITEVPN